MTKKILEQMRREPTNVRFTALLKVCVEYFGEPRRATAIRLQPRGVQNAWPGDPRVNIQNDNGKAKAYQIRQVLNAIDKLTESQHAS